MKLASILIIVGCLQASARSFGQSITFSGSKVSLETVFKSIKQQTGFLVVYNSDLLQSAKPVTVSATNMPLSDFLRQTLKGQPFEYQIEGKTIVISSTPPDKRTDGDGTSLLAVFPVSGVVHDAEGVPVANVSVSVKGSNNSTSTDYQGRFGLNVNVGDVLVFTSIGFERTEITIKNTSSLTITLSKAVSTLDELQVIAYGSTTKRFQTGNVATVKGEDIQNQPVSNPLLALQGRVAGLFITQSTGIPGSGVAVRIQGQNTMGTLIGNDPLYVIDGVPYPARMISSLSTVQGTSGSNAPDQVSGPIRGSGAGSPMSYINPNDIESIEILKDADATAIYGSRAANGAILITTKKGKSGVTKVSINFQKGWGKVAKELDVMNAEEYLAMRNKALSNDGLKADSTIDFDLIFWDPQRHTNWQKELIGGTANYVDASASISGGNGNTQFFISPGYHKETTVFPGNSGSNSGSIHFSLNNTSSNQKFNVQLSGSYLLNNTNLMNGDLTAQAVNLAPNAPALYNNDGTLNWAQLKNGDATWMNPLAYLSQKYSNKVANLIGNATIGYKIIRNLEVKSSFGYTDLRSDEYLLSPWSAMLPQDRATRFPSSTFSQGNTTSWIAEPQIRYFTQGAKGAVEVLVGSSFQKRNNYLNKETGSNYASDLQLQNINAAPTKFAQSGFSIYKYSAFFGRFNYNWQGKYILNLNARRDGSSRFGRENQLHNFYSIGGAWLFSNENFFKGLLPFISFGKLKASYGTSGNDQIGDYQFLDLYNPVSVQTPVQGSIGYLPANLTNPYLQWEETKKLNTGVNLGFFKERIILEVNYSQNRSSNQLVSYNLPYITGFSSIVKNFPALVQNNNWEFSLVSKNISTKNFNWSTTFNLTIPKNKLLQFPGLEKSTYSNTYVIGQPITVSKVYRSSGIDNTTGLYQFIDTSGKLVASPSYIDAQFLINESPTLYGGLGNEFSWKGFELNLFFQFVKQIGYDNTYNFTTPGTFFGTSNVGNQLSKVSNNWEKSGDGSKYQKLSTTLDAQSGYSYQSYSSSSYTDASFIRLKNLSIGWNLPKSLVKQIKFNNLKVFVHGQNLLTITKYKGLDPETKTATSLPPLRVITIGINCSL